VSRAAFIVAVLSTLAAAAVFSAAPEIDLRVASGFFGHGGFSQDRHWLHVARMSLYWFPVVVLGICVLAFAGGRMGWRMPFGLTVSGRGLAFMILSLLLGPWLIVNVGLKDHWHRPRPIQVHEFGGTQDFRPFWDPRGGCDHNCSFVSGETSTAFWLVAPASLTPPPLRTPAVAAALGIGAVTGLIRMALGGHFLSDVVFAGAIPLLITQALYLWLIDPARARRVRLRGRLLRRVARRRLPSIVAPLLGGGLRRPAP
jgi:membrane-associated phospholipid phosphatase